MVDGVDVNDTINGTANNLYIEDAIQNTTRAHQRHLRRVRALLRRRGQHGHPQRWKHVQRELSREPEQPVVDQRDAARALEWRRAHEPARKTHEATFGGPVCQGPSLVLRRRDAGRRRTRRARFSQTGVAYTRTDTNRRGELKLTGRFRAADTLSGTYINNSTEQVNASGIGAAAILDQSVLVTRTLPNRLLAVNYSGVGRARHCSRLCSIRRSGSSSGTMAAPSTALTEFAVRDAGRDRRRAACSIMRRISMRPIPSSATTSS